MSYRCTALAIVGLACCVCLHSQTIPSAVQSAGASASANREYRVQASCAQSSIGPSAAATFNIHAGFWHPAFSESQQTDVCADKSGLELLPQPAHSTMRVRLSSSQKQKVSIELINLLGERFIQINDQSDETPFVRDLDVSAVPSGTYTLRIIGESETFSHMCVIQH